MSCLYVPLAMPCSQQFKELYLFLGSLQILDYPQGWEQKILTTYRLLLEANQKINLTRITAFRDYLIKHVADSLLLKAILPDLAKKSLNIADVGCGPGFPGIPLALTFSNVAVTEIDSTQKKIDFVQSLIEQLNLNNCQTIHARAGELANRREFRQTYDLVIARAVKNTQYLIRECRYLMAPGWGRLIVYKTPNKIDEERREVEKVAKKFHLFFSESKIFELPAKLGDRQFIMITHQKKEYD